MKLTASKVALADFCQYPFRPDVKPPHREVGVAAAVGTEVHAMVESKVKGRTHGSATPQAVAVYDQVIQHVPKGLESEVAFAYNVTTDTARVLNVEARDYATVTSDEVAGTADLVGGGLLIDIKTGKRVDHPKDSAQLATLGLSYARVQGLEEVTVGILTAKGLTTHTLDAIDLDSRAHRLRKILKMIPDAEPVGGQHCWKCDFWYAKSGCPIAETR